jgi:hypothetical protein
MSTSAEQVAVADMARLQIAPHGPGIRMMKAFVLRAGRQACHAAKLWRQVAL